MNDQAISQTAILFSRYIKQESEWKDVTKIPKDVLRQFYTEQYKPKYKMDNPGCNIVNFARLFIVIIFETFLIETIVRYCTITSLGL